MLSKFSVRKPYTIVVAVVLVLLLGTISFMNLQTDLLPSIDLPYVVVMTTYPGASPEEVETFVTRPIEQVVATTSNIKNVSSVSRENSSLVILEFNNDVNMDSAVIEINGSLDMIKGMFNDSISSPMVIRLNPDMLPIMVSSVDVEDMDISEVSLLVSNRVIPELESVNGVASVTGVGLLEEEIEVVISQEKIDRLNKRILESIDSELSQAEDQLLDAKSEIQTGKAQIDLESKKQLEVLAEGEKAITEGKDQIELAENAFKIGLATINKSKTDLENVIKEIELNESSLKTSIDTLASQGDNISTEDKVKLEGLKQSLAALEEKKQESYMGLTLINEKLDSTEKEFAALLDKKTELSKQEEEIAKGREMLTSEMNKAKAQLTSGERTIDENLKKLEESKEEAFKRASLDGVISSKMISGILVAQNFSMPAGYIEDENVVKVGNKLKDIEEMKGLLLFDTKTESVGKVYLQDVSDIELKDNSKDIYAKVNGNDAVMLTFQKQSNFPTAEVSDSIKEKMNQISADIDGLTMTNLMDQGLYIDIVVDSVLDNILYGGILAILILIFFLKDLKPTFIIAVSIPISIIFAIAMMYFTGVTINVISLAGLALGVGMLVDNSIVVIENIYRLRSEGMSASKASIEGAKEVAGAITSSTITTAAVFLPIVFTKGISRQLFTDMGLTIAYSLFASLIVALTLVPTMGSAMLKNVKEKEHKVFDKFIKGYESILRWSLKYKGLVMILVVGLLVASAYAAVSMGTSFIPQMDAPQMSMTVNMPEGSTFEDMVATSDLVTERIKDIEGIQTIGSFSGSGMGMGVGMGMSSGGASSNNNSVSMYLILDEDMKVSNKEIENQILNLTEDINANISIDSNNMDMTALAGSGLEVVIKGKELDGIRDVASDITNILQGIEGIEEVKSGLDRTSNEIRITVDKEKAMENSLTVAQVFSEINSLLAKGKSATTLSTTNKDYPVIVVDGRNENISREDLEDLTIELKQNEEEKKVRIGDIATISEEEGLSSIRRDSQQRYLSLNASLLQDYNIGLVSRDFESKLDEYNIPDGYTVEIKGERELISNSLRDLVYMLLLSIAFIYLIMVAQFQSLLSPFIVMFTIPLAFTGGLLALIITGYDLSVISMLGFLVLSGVVVNNGIVFVDFTNQLRDSGLTTKEALVEAGKTRMRPILMTAITTILGLYTLSMGVGVGAEMLQPLAIVAIGGLTYATILTLIVVPVMYELLHKNKIRRNFLEGDEN